MSKRPPRLKDDPPWMKAAKAGMPPRRPGRARAAIPGEPPDPDADTALWEKLAAGVRPLSQTKHKRHASPLSPRGRGARGEGLTEGKGDTASARAEAPATASPRDRETPLPLPAKPSTPAPRPLVPGALADLDRRSGERLRKGEMAIDAKLDLHGMTQDAAHGTVTRYLHAAHAAGKRCILIVTGKGGRGGTRNSAAERFSFTPERGVLRDALPRWLNEAGLRGIIVAITPAQRQHGGDGAVYVLLKRKRG